MNASELANIIRDYLEPRDDIGRAEIVVTPLDEELNAASIAIWTQGETPFMVNVVEVTQPDGS